MAQTLFVYVITLQAKLLFLFLLNTRIMGWPNRGGREKMLKLVLLAVKLFVSNICAIFASFIYRVFSNQLIPLYISFLFQLFNIGELCDLIRQCDLTTVASTSHFIKVYLFLIILIQHFLYFQAFTELWALQPVEYEQLGGPFFTLFLYDINA
jgi:hypothetical protein